MKPKKIVITGASSGFGKLAAFALAQRGHSVVAGIRGGEARLKKLVAELPNPTERARLEECLTQGSLQACDLHMDQPETFSRLDALLAGWKGEVDVLINNAGYGFMGPVHLTSPEELRHQFEVNFFGPAALTQRLVPALEKTGGRIINLSSAMGLVAMPLYGPYASSKFALEALTESMAYELRFKGIQTCLVEPGGFRTEFAGSSYKRPAVTQTADGRGHEMMNTFAQKMLVETAKMQGNPVRVSNLLVRLVEKRGSLRLRYLIGPDARALACALRIVPRRVMRTAFAIAFRPFLRLPA